MLRKVIWTALRWPSREEAEVTVEAGVLSARGHVFATLDGTATRVDYTLRTDAGGAVRRVRVDVDGRLVDLRADGRGGWSDADGRRPDLDGCLDVDIAVTPLTNTLPIRRLGLPTGGSRDIDVVYVDVPSLVVTRAAQRYTRTATGYRYEAGSFTADLTVDDADLVTDYADLWRRG